MLASLLSTFTNPRISPSSWEPSSSLPTGSTSIVETFRAPCSPRSAVELIAERGAWSHGTVLFTRATAGGKTGSVPEGAYNAPSTPSGSGPGSGAAPAQGKAGEDGPPSYEAVVGMVAGPEKARSSQQLEDGGAYIEVRVESRWNDEQLWDEAKVDLVQTAAGAIQLIIQVRARALTLLIGSY